MAHFRQRFRVEAPLAAVWQLHADPQALRDLTPPPLRVHLVRRDDPLQPGSELVFRMVLVGPLAVTWHAVYDEYAPYVPGQATCGFVDRALSGPFHTWTHRHTFERIDDQAATVTDEVAFQLVGGPLGGPVSWLVGWPALAFLFLFRRFKTRHLCARMRAAGGGPA